jgi:hypothetical protein
MIQETPFSILADGFTEDYLIEVSLIETLESVFLDEKTQPDTKLIAKECLEILYKERDRDYEKAERYRALHTAAQIGN